MGADGAVDHRRGRPIPVSDAPDRRRTAMATDRSDGMTYAPKGQARPVVGPGEFVVAAVHLDHGHIYGMCNGLVEAGAEVRWVYDPDPDRVAAFIEAFPSASAARSLDEVLDDDRVNLVAAAAVPSERCALGIAVMEAGKDYFTDKAPLTTLDQLAQAKDAVRRTGRKYLVYYSERLHSEAAVRAGELIEGGAIGRVVQVIGLGPHRLNAPARPAWFFDKARYGGILVDLGCHQLEQFLAFSGARDAHVQSARVANVAYDAAPGLEDFGEASLVADNGASSYFRVDWLTPAGLPTWGDGRTMILGTEGTIELRKYLDLAHEVEGDHLYLVDAQGVQHHRVAGTVGFPFFGQLVLDGLNRTERAMTQEHAFKAAELSLLAQRWADERRNGPKP
jgi:predicted dehydrogenase